jgi:hypothetical protein
MEKITYSDGTYFYKDVLNLSEYKNDLLNKCSEVIASMPHITTDGYDYSTSNDNNKLDDILNFGIECCKELYKIEYNKSYDLIHKDCWINVVRAKNPVQYKNNNDLDYHIHTEINKKLLQFYPHYTWVYYIQMPDNLKEDEGALYMKGPNGDEHFIIPNEGDMIIMPGHLPHSPKVALNSTKDRIVLAGNVGFELIKKQKTLI